MYINPLLKILERQNPQTRLHPYMNFPRNGVFDTDPSQTLVLLIDFKTDGTATWPYVFEQLAPLREGGYLTHFNGTVVVDGPITVVGSGNAPFDSIVSNSTYRDIFFDTSLDELAGDGHGGARNQGSTRPRTVSYDSTNSYYASSHSQNRLAPPGAFVSHRVR